MGTLSFMVELFPHHQLWISSISRSPTTSSFDGAYDSDSQQEDLFKNEIEPMIGSVFKGIHTTIFAYGITGAGTSYVPPPQSAARIKSFCCNAKDFHHDLHLTPMLLQARPSRCRARTSSRA